MPLEDRITQIATSIRAGQFGSEAAVSQGIVLPILNELGWPVFDTSIVIPEYSVENKRVDYALCHPKIKPLVFIEVKKVGLLEGGDKQLFEYAFHRGVPMAILTDGQEWSFYLPAEQGRYDERRVYKLDLLERNEKEASHRLFRYLEYGGVCTGKALEYAREDYKDVSKNRTVRNNIPKAWKLLLEEQDSLLLDLLAEKVEDICGFRPAIDACAKFILDQLGSLAQLPSIIDKANHEKQTNYKDANKSLNGNFYFEFNGIKTHATSAREVMTIAFKTFGEKDNSFFQRYTARKHGKKRRYLSENKKELYPGRIDLAELHSFEIAKGWWLGTNYSRRDISKIISLAIEVYKTNNECDVSFAV